MSRCLLLLSSARQMCPAKKKKKKKKAMTETAVGARVGDIEALCRYATQVEECAPALAGNDVVADLVAELGNRAAAVRSEAAAPIRVGVVSDFSAGKSLMIGVLAGRPDLLEVSSEPTTGNVTEVRLAPSDAAHTEVDAAQVQYFSRAELDALRHHTAGVLAAASANKVSREVVEELAAARRAWGVGAISALCTRLAGERDTMLRAVTGEWLALDAAEQAAGPDLLGTTRTMSTQEYKQILRRPGVNSEFAATYPLVRRVVLEVGVPRKGGWPLDELCGLNSLALLDFPGADGGISPARDGYLIKAELATVHTILALVNSARPGGQAAGECYGHLRELGFTDGDLADRVLTCASLFDAMTPPHLDQPDADGLPRLTEGAVREASSTLQTLLDLPPVPGAASFAAFFSPVRAIDTLGLTGEGMPPADKFPFANFLPGSRRNAEGWDAVAKRLVASGTGRDLAELLRSFVADGGVGRLRAVLENHVLSHGMVARMNRLEASVDRLDVTKDELVEFLQEVGAERGSAQLTRRTQVDRLLGEFDRARDDILKGLAQLRDTPRVPLRHGWTLDDELSQAAADRVLDWPEWETVFKTVDGGTVMPPTRTSGRLPPRRPRGSLQTTSELPASTAVFRAKFERTCTELHTSMSALARRVLQDWLDARQRDLADLLASRNAILTPEVVGRIGDRFDVQTVLEFGDFAGLADWAWDGVAALLAEEDADGSSGHRPAFPLWDDHVLGWATDPPAPPADRHVVRALRMRSALVDSAADATLRALDVTFLAVVDELRAEIDEASRFPMGRDRSDLVGAVLGDVDDDPAGHDSSMAEMLASLRRPARSYGGRG